MDKQLNFKSFSTSYLRVTKQSRNIDWKIDRKTVRKIDWKINNKVSRRYWKIDRKIDLRKESLRLGMAQNKEYSGEKKGQG